MTGSRADAGLLAWPIKVLSEEFEVVVESVAAPSFGEAFSKCQFVYQEFDLVLMLGDRWEILAAAVACHLQRVPIAHIAGGDVTEGSYDDAMRDCISRLASIHFVTSLASANRLQSLGCKNVHLVGNTAVDYIKHGPWRDERPIAGPYVVVAYYPETIDDTVDLDAVNQAIDGRVAVWVSSNPDRGSDRIPPGHSFSHDDFLNLLANCEEFIGNSSALLYEAPELGIKTTMIGKRQRGRVKPWGDGKASERIRDILKHV